MCFSKPSFVGCAVCVLVVCSLLNIVNSDTTGPCGPNLTCTHEDDGTLRVNGYGNMSDNILWLDKSSITSIEIGDGVTSIGISAFANCPSLTSVSIPDNVIYIGDNAFGSCQNLRSVVIGNGVEFIGPSAFESCTALTDVVIGNKVKTIGNSAFSYCSNLTSIIIPDSVLSVGESMFQDCSNLTSAVIGNCVTSIRSDFFKECRKLNNVTIGKKVASIEERAFAYCSSLSTIVIPDSVTLISDFAFAFTNISYIFIPENVSEVRGGAFADCLNLKSLFYQGTNITTLFSCFDVCNRLNSVCVAPGYVSSSFCEKNVSSSSETCDAFQSMFNHCFMGSYINGDFVKQKRKNATEWESQGDGCIRYECDNDIGQSKKVICSRSDGVSRICMGGECVEENKEKEENPWIVEVELNDVFFDEVNVTGLRGILQEITERNIDDIKIGYEIDANGYILRVILFLDDENLANDIAKSISDNSKEKNCRVGILCRAKNVRVSGIQSNVLSFGCPIMINVLLLTLAFFFLMES